MRSQVAAAALERQTSLSRRWIILALVTLGVLIAYIDRADLSVALATKEFISFFHLTDRDRGALNSAFFWSYAFLQLPAGWLVDRYGVKFPFAISFSLYSLLTAATSLGNSAAQLLGLRFLLGVGESVAVPASMRWIRFQFAEKERGLAVGIMMSGTKLGPALGLSIPAWLIAGYGWRMMFVILGVGCLVWLIPWLVLAKNDDRQREQAAVKSSRSPTVSFGQIMASPVIWGTIIGTFCYMYFVYYCMTWMPAYLVERRNLSLKSTGLYSFFSFTGMAVTAIISGWVADRMIARGSNPVRVRKGFTIAGFVMASTEVFGAISDSNSAALFFAMFSLTGLGLATANYWALTQTLIPGGAIGRIVGIQNCAANLPGIVAPILTGWLKQATGSYTAPMQAIWFFLILGLVAYIFLVREKYAPGDSA
jgi:MFS family permease